MSQEIISHQGRIKKIENGKIYVAIVSNSSCISCSAKTACSASDQAEKIIEVPMNPQENYQVNDPVVVAISQKAGLTAVFYSYILPLILMLVVLITVGVFLQNEGLAALLSLLSLPLYYLALYFLKDKLVSFSNFFIKD